ncbi:hypothetical protein ACFQ4N_18275 [Oceanobacillus iheyensis]|uniref:hypothetical protein n=1 Tax=Oceanobacillus iheyensis TaxID=182710 RepID=UPI00363E48C1
MRKAILLMLILIISLFGCRQEVSRETATVQFALFDRASEPINGITTVVTEAFEGEPVSDIGMVIEGKPTDHIVEVELTIGTMYHFSFQQNGNVIHEEEVRVAESEVENMYTILIE